MVRVYRRCVVARISIGRWRNRVHASLDGEGLHRDRIARRLGGGDGGRGRGQGGRRGARRRRLGRQRVAGRRLRLLLLDGAGVRGRRRLHHRACHRRRRHRRNRGLKNRLLDLRTLHRLHDYRRLNSLPRRPSLHRRRPSHSRRRAGRLCHRNRTRRSGRGSSRVYA